MIDSTATAVRYARQTVFQEIGPEGQERLRQSRVCVVGVGALGTHVADALARAGIGFLRLVDRDLPEITNLQRQVLFDEADVEAGEPKAIAAAARLARINGGIDLDPRVLDVNQTNVEGLITDVDFVIDGSDNFELRYLLNDACVKLGKPWIYAGVIGSYGMTMTIRPGITPCLRCVFPDSPAPGDSPTCETAGVIGPAVALIAAVEAAEALKLAIGADEALNTDLLALDAWNLSFDRIPLGAPNPDCPACARRDFGFLERATPSQTTSLCGRDAVQVLMQPPARISLPQLAERLKPLGRVGVNAYLLRFAAGEHELTVFPDGRAIVKGTTDPAEARSLYARYIGM